MKIMLLSIPLDSLLICEEGPRFFMNLSLIVLPFFLFVIVHVYANLSLNFEHIVFIF